MNAESQTSLLEGITYTDNLPVTWEVLAVLPSVGEQHRRDRDNEDLVQNLLLRDDISHDGEEKEDGGYPEHLRRLETKLDLVLSLVTEMMTDNGSLPQKSALILGTRGLCVHTPKEALASLKIGTLLRIKLYLDSQFPRPLDICGEIIALQTEAFTVNFGPLEAHLQDLLDKLVFRRHRRDIALSRRIPEA